MKRSLPSWPWIVYIFYNRVEIYRNEVTEHNPNRTIKFKIWKSIGDEVLLYHEISADDEIEKAINSVVMMKHFLDGAIDTALLAAKSIHSQKQLRHDRPKRTKSSIWTIETTNSVPSSTFDFMQLPKGNIACTIDGRLDFVGPNVDYGFRISNKADSNKIIVSNDVLNAFKKMKETGTCIEPANRYSVGAMEHVSLKGITEDTTLNYLYEVE